MKNQLHEAASGWSAMPQARLAEPSVEFAAKTKPQGSVRTWPDPQLIAAVRPDVPNPAALDELANRYWKQLFGRCRLLAVDPKKAAELAQETWCQVLRERRALKPGDDFSAMLMTAAISLWQARQSAKQPGDPVADERSAVLESAPPNELTDNGHLSAATFHLNALSSEDQTLLATRIDNALARLAPARREVLVAHLIAGESCAQIARRHQQSEQAITGWLRQAMRELEQLLPQ